MRYKILTILLLLIFTSNAQNFNRFNGIPFIKNYSSEEYKAHEQNFDIIQDNRGVMYFANFAGVLEFDGSVWTKIPTKSGMRVLSLEKDSKGKIYTGGLYDFGYILQNTKGKSYFVSLADSIENKEDIGEIFNIHSVKDKMYFVSKHSLFIYNQSKITTIKYKEKIIASFVINNKIFIFFENKLPENSNLKTGLNIFENGKLIKVKDNSNSKIIDVISMFAVPNIKGIVIVTSRQGFFLLQNNNITDFDAPVNAFVKTHGFTGGLVASKSTYALGTLTGGVIITDIGGNIIQIIDKESRLQDETINKLYLDKRNDLWIATNNGISKTEINSNLTYIDNNISGLEGRVYDIINFRNKLYFATDNGLYFLHNTNIKKVNEINYACWDLLKVNNNLLAATSRGIYIINDNVKLSNIQDFTLCLAQNSNNLSTIYSGHNSKVKILNFNNNNLSTVKIISGLEKDVRSIKSDNKGNLYFEIPPGEIIRYTLNTSKLKECKSDLGFMSLYLNKKGKDIFFSSEKGLFVSNEKSSKLEPYNLLDNSKSIQKLWIKSFFELPNQNFIFTDGEQKNLTILEKNKSNYVINQTPFLPISNFSVNTLFYDKKTSFVWAGGKDGVIIYDTKKITKSKTTFKTLISAVIITKNDSLIDINKSNDEITSLKFANNSLHFKFSAPMFPAEGNIEYRFKLEGFDEDTSAWTSVSSKDYTNLPDGEYNFVVQARNQYDKIAIKDSCKFEILTPMYRRWWAIIAYILIAILIIRAVFNWRMKVAEKEKEELEEIVKDRTLEIEESKIEIEQQRDLAYEQRKEILDSINYAQRIQEAVMPSKEYTDEVLKEHFIMFKPRDIVSGDFYWIKKMDNFVAIAAADCTGHGVPGAFMSMLGSSFLNEIVNRKTLTNAGEILTQLRKKVKTSLHQEGKSNEQKDGMDIAFLIINIETKKIYFSGAYNPLYIIRQENDTETPELHQLKADRQPIGIHIKEKEFTNHEFQLQNNDKLYMFSDGYVDQFGGATGSKFKIKKLKNLLIEIYDKSMQEQHLILKQTFNKWKGELAQVDDVLLIGIEI